MNIKVCKKCKGTENIFFHAHLITDDKKEEIVCTFKNPFHTCNHIHFNFKYEDKIRQIVGKSNSYVARFMDIDESCPYYIEHKLSEWNKK